ncbi:MAG: hypothetical protein JXQ90_14500 [Cyclobacteriaceae bacterium]
MIDRLKNKAPGKSMSSHKYSKTIFAFVCMLLMGAVSLPAQYKFKHLNIPLNSNRIECIAQDYEGYIWIGTLAGLHKYDGVNLTEYLYSNDTTSLNASRVYQVLEDRRNRFWIATENGIYEYNRDLDNFKRHVNEPIASKNGANNHIHDIHEDKRGRIWVSGAAGGLQLFDEKRKEFRSVIASWNAKLLTQHTVLDIESGPDQTLLLGTSDFGVWVYDDQSSKIERFGQINIRQVLGDRPVRRLFVDSQDQLWVMLSDFGVLKTRLESSMDAFTLYQNQPDDNHSLFNNRVDHMIEDAKGNIWLANQNGGLHLFNPEEDNFTRFQPSDNDPNSIGNMSVRYLFEDRQGRFWVGSHLAGIDIYDPAVSKFELYEYSETGNSISSPVVTSFLETSAGNIWITTDGGGLNFMDRSNNQFTSYQRNEKDKNSIGSNAALCIERDNQGGLWIGTWQTGISVFNPNSGKFTTPYASIEGLRDIYSMFKDSQGNMWIGGYRYGLSIFNPDGNLISSYESDPSTGLSLNDDNILHFMETSKGEIWIATEFNGLNKTSGDPQSLKFHRYAHDPNDSNSLASNTVNFIFEDQDQHIWAATEGGLSKYIPELNHFENFDSDHGFDSDNIRSIASDKEGRLWMGTSKSLTRFDPKTYEVKNYYSDDGVQSGEFNKRAIKKLSTGEIAIGGYKGYNIFHPDSMSQDHNVPIPKIIGLSIFNQPVEIGANSVLKKHMSQTDQINLAYDQSVFTISYVGIGFTQPDRTQYAYRLQNFEEQWNFVRTRKEATYTNLDPGNYIFEVKSANRDGIWSEEVASIQIIIIPPWWMTTYFYIGLIIIVLAGIIGFIRYRTISLIERKKELERQVVERTTEVSNLNTQLEDSNNQLLEKAKHLEETIKTLKETKSKLLLSEKMASLGIFTAGIAHEINNPINFISGATQGLFELYEKSNKLGKEDQEIYLKLKEIIGMGVEKSSQIISSLRNYSYNENQNFEAYNIVECCEDALVILSHKIKPKSIQIDSRFPKSLTCECLPGKIGQLFVNLLSNAIDAVAHKGTIAIEMTSSDDCITILIRDNGIGIDQAEIPHLFDPFYTTKEAGKGTGLGLYISYGIIEEHAGKITVDSGDKGTQFKIELPKRQQSK